MSFPPKQSPISSQLGSGWRLVSTNGAWPCSEMALQRCGNGLRINLLIVRSRSDHNMTPSSSSLVPANYWLQHKDIVNKSSRCSEQVYLVNFKPHQTGWFLLAGFSSPQGWQEQEGRQSWAQAESSTGKAGPSQAQRWAGGGAERVKHDNTLALRGLETLHANATDEKVYRSMRK